MGFAAHFAVVTAVLLLLFMQDGRAATEEEEVPVKVEIKVFYESLCPDSQNFIVNQLFPTWQTLSDIMEVDLYAYGKARETGNENQHYNCTCQHGPKECDGNAMLTCAKEFVTDMKHFMAFTNCIMKKLRGAQAGEYCANQVGFNYTDIATCLGNGTAEELLHEISVLQAELDPALNYVPWILVNDIYTKEQHRRAQRDLQRVVCEAYKGLKPPGCMSLE